MFKNVPKEVYDIISKIEYEGFEAYIVGGCVRDCIMGIEPHDYDICTSALPEETMQIFRGEGMVTAGLKHGTVGIIRGKNVYEITTYRLDGDYSDGRHPDSVTFTNMLSEDLLRRDFTINAMAYNPKCGLVDIYGGREDLENGVIRCVGNPLERFSEDALRILRAIRFASRFGFRVEEETKKAMQKLYPTIEKVSIERINTEFTKTLVTKNASEYIDEFRDIIALFIPEIKPMFGFEQNSRWHNLDVWQHTLRAISCSGEDIYIRLALFLHDIAKPATYTPDEEGNGHFYKHAYEGMLIAKKILKRLKYSNDIIDTVCTLVGAHDFGLSSSKKSVKKLLQRLGEENFDRLMRVRYADLCAHREEMCAGDKDVIFQMKSIKEQIISDKECFDIKSLDINGSILIGLGIKPGPQIGKILSALLEEVIEEKLENKQEVLIEYVNNML